MTEEDEDSVAEQETASFKWILFGVIYLPWS
jgi:hypothetical protein